MVMPLPHQRFPATLHFDGCFRATFPTVCRYQCHHVRMASGRNGLKSLTLEPSTQLAFRENPSLNVELDKQSLERVLKKPKHADNVSIIIMYGFI